MMVTETTQRNIYAKLYVKGTEDSLTDQSTRVKNTTSVLFVKILLTAERIGKWYVSIVNSEYQSCRCGWTARMDRKI